MQRRERDPGIEAQVEAARRRFEQWRHLGRGGRRIPEELWLAAVELAQRQGVHRTVLALRLNAQALKARFEATRQRPAAVPTSPVRFVELAMAEPSLQAGGGWELELEDGRGAKLRVKVLCGAAPDLGELARAFLREPR